MTGNQNSKDKLIILGAVCMAALVLPLDFSGVAIATPEIARELGGSAIAVNWVVNAFMLSFGSLLMTAGALADEFGRKRLFVIGLGAFFVVSLAIGFSSNILWLDILRAAQGVAAAATLASGTAALAQEYEGHARARAFSLLGTTFGVGLAFGPTLAGLLINAFGWRSIFTTSAVMSLFALIVGAPRMKESKNPQANGMDWPGVITFTLSLVLFTFGTLEGPEIGWNHWLTLALLGGSFVTFAIFVIIETYTKHPMLDLSLFKIPRFLGVQALPIATCYSYVVLLILLPARFIGIEGMTELHAGVLMISISACMLFVPFVAASLTKSISPRIISVVGLLIAAFGLLWLSQVAPHSSFISFAIPMFFIGLGASMPWGLMDSLSVSVVPKERAGMAAGIFSTTRVAGEGIALAITRAILAILIQGKLASGIIFGSSLHTETQASQVGQYLASGELTRAASMVPQIGSAPLLLAYADAFKNLLYILTFITLISAAIIFVFLRPAQKSQA